MERSSHSFQRGRERKRKRGRVTFRSHSLKMQTKEEVSLRRSEKVLGYCSPSHYEEQNRRHLTRQNNETRRGWERGEEGKQEIMKTSLISADTSPHLSHHCRKLYKFRGWDVLRKSLIVETTSQAVTVTIWMEMQTERAHCPSGNKLFTQTLGVRMLYVCSISNEVTGAEWGDVNAGVAGEEQRLPNVSGSLGRWFSQQWKLTSQ